MPLTAPELTSPPFWESSTEHGLFGVTPSSGWGLPPAGSGRAPRAPLRLVLVSEMSAGGARLWAWSFLFRKHLFDMRPHPAGVRVSVDHRLVMLVIYGALTAALWSSVGPLLAAAGAVVVLSWWLMLRYKRVGVPVTASSQPNVHHLVCDTAASLDVPVPDRIWLGHTPEVMGRVRLGMRELVIGVGATDLLPRDELAALVAHELSVLAAWNRTVSIRLYREWARLADQRANRGEGSDPDERDAMVLERLDALGEAIERDADGRVSDARTASLALLRLKRIRHEFTMFSMRTVAALSEPVGSRRYAAEDLHDGLRRRIASGGGVLGKLAIDADEAAAVGRCHPGLATAARTLVGHPLSPAAPADTMVVTTLSARERRLLSGMTSRWVDPGWRTRGRRWRTLESLPARVWSAQAVARAQPVRAAITKVLGREPADCVEAAEVIRDRPNEVAHEWAPWTVEVPEADRHRVGLWHLLLEAELLSNGWVPSDPAIMRLLRAPDGTQLDVWDLVEAATSNPLAWSQLRALCSRPGAFEDVEVPREEQ
jgi:hypothetical protein